MDESVFSSIDVLEPKCPGCGIKIEFDVNTEFDEEKQAVVCKNCGCII
mgnify:CR=1 FL=1